MKPFVRPSSRSLVRLAAVVATTALAATTFAPPATAKTTLAHGLLSPLSLAVAPDGTVFATENFKGTLHRIAPGQPPAVLYQAAEGVEVGAVSVDAGAVTFAVTRPDGTADLMRIPAGSTTPQTLASASAFEATGNPDAAVEYGIRNISKRCAKQFPKRVPASYTGIVESHPYATTTLTGVTYLIDAAGNTLLRMTPTGLATVAVLPPSPLRVTRARAAMFKLPDCAVGKKYYFESVPTDVEAGPDGMLYVSSLPGGPEDPSLGARGRVFRVDPATGAATRVAKNLISPTGLAVSPAGDIYVAELFGNQVSRIRAGSSRAKPYRTVRMPGDVEWGPAGLYGTIKVMTGMSGEKGDAPRGKVIVF